MQIVKELLQQIDNPILSPSERALLRCQLAKQLEEAGNYESAREALGDLWSEVGQRPTLETLEQLIAAEVLLRVGTLTGWIGSAKQIEGAQELAKNLISESIRIFETTDSLNKVAEAQSDLAVCYWREGAFSEANVILQDALRKLSDADGETKAVALLRSAIVEESAGRYHDALRIHVSAAPLFENSNNSVMKGKFHHLFGFVLKKLAEAENRRDYVDKALIEYAAAGFYFERAGLQRYEGCVENNLGFLFCNIGKFAEAHEHLDRAQMLFTVLKDDVHLAQVDETRARVMLAEGRVVEAEKTARTAVRTLEQGDEQALLAEALTTHGTALARLKHPEQAWLALERALVVAERAGDLESAGNAAMVLIEELGTFLSNDDLKATVDRARELLTNTQDLSTLKRLTACASRVLALVHASPRFPGTVDWNTFSFKHAILEYEAHFIRLALEDTGGVVSRAARLLGFNHHQSLLALLNGRHEILRHRSTPIVPRRRSIIRNRASNGSHPRNKRRSKNKVRILHVEDNQTLAQMMQERLELDGYEVEICADGNEALEKITGNFHYNLLLLDNELPGTSGLQLAQHARSLAHHHRTPIIILSATLDDETARLAGADAFLRKPEDITAVGETVAKLLQSSAK
jgi:CheY-like chemotaxis protein